MNKTFSKWKVELLHNYLRKDAKVLDVGSGFGKLADCLPDKSNYIGLELNKSLVEKGVKDGLNIIHHDVMFRFPLEDNSVSVVFISHLLEHFLPREQLEIMQEVYRVLDKGGKVLIFCPAYHPFFYDEWSHVRPHTGDSLKVLANESNLLTVTLKYSFLRKLSQDWQHKLRWFLRPLLWEIFGVFEK